MIQEENNNKLLLVDGMALLFRGFFANSYGGSVRRTSSGVPVNAIYGFIKYFMDAVQKFGTYPCRMLLGYGEHDIQDHAIRRL